MTGWDDALFALEQSQVTTDRPLAAARDIYTTRILPLHEAHPNLSSRERAIREDRALANLRLAGTIDTGSNAYALPGYLNMCLRNPDHWTMTGAGTGSGMIPRPGLNALISQALGVAKTQATNPYLPLYRGIMAHINGLDETATRHFQTAAQYTNFPKLVTDCLRGASLARDLPNPCDLLHCDSVPPLPKLEVLHRGVETTGPMLSFCGDSVYFRAFSLCVAESLAKVRQEPTNLHFHIVQTEPDDPNLPQAIAILTRFCAAHNQRLCLTRETSPGAGRAYFATSRFLRIGAFLDLFDRPILVSDLDVSYLADPIPVIAEQGFDRCRAVRSAGPFWGFVPWRHIWAGQILFVPTREGRLFANVLRRAAVYLWRDESHLNWWIDQYALWLTGRVMRQLGYPETLGDLTGYSAYLTSSEAIKIKGLQRIDNIASAMEDGVDWHAALLQSQAG